MAVLVKCNTVSLRKFPNVSYVRNAISDLLRHFPVIVVQLL